MGIRLDRFSVGAALAGLLGASTAAAQPIDTFAGGNGLGNGGDGLPAVTAELTTPSDTCTDASGNVYIVDHADHSVRMVDTTGIIERVAGGNGQGFAGNGGAATSAELHHPKGCEVVADTLFVAETNGIRRVDLISGTIDQFAGGVGSGLSGDGGSALLARMDLPESLAFHDGYLYVSDSGNHTIRRIDLSSHVITRVAGTGASGYNGDGIAATTAQLNVPWDIDFDSAGNLYVADRSNHRVRRITPGGTISTFAGGNGYVPGGIPGPATAATIPLPTGLAVASDGDVFVTMTYGPDVVRIDGATQVAWPYVGTGACGDSGDGGPYNAAEMCIPSGLHVDDLDRLYITEAWSNNPSVRRVAYPTCSSCDVIYEFDGSTGGGCYGTLRYCVEDVYTDDVRVQVPYMELYHPVTIDHDIEIAGNNAQLFRASSTGTVPELLRVDAPAGGIDVRMTQLRILGGWDEGALTAMAVSAGSPSNLIELQQCEISAFGQSFGLPNQAVHVQSGNELRSTNSGYYTNRTAQTTILIDSGATFASISDSFVDNRSNQEGASIHNLGEVSIEDSVFEGGHCEFGGAIFQDSGKLSLFDSELRSNEALTGGAIQIDGGELYVTRTLFESNEASGGPGGAIYVLPGASGPISVEEGQFYENLADTSWGGAIALEQTSGSVVVRDSHFEGNEATRGGAGIWTERELLVDRSSFVQNRLVNPYSSFGGGVYVGGSTTTMRNCTAFENGDPSLGVGLGGNVAVVAEAGVPAELRLVHTTLVGGLAVDAANAYASGSKVELVFDAASVSQAQQGDSCQFDAGASHSDQSSLDDDATCMANTNTSVIGGDPGLDTLDFHGGPTMYFTLSGGGDPLDLVPADACATNEDQAQGPRPVGSGCDAGAYEMP